MITLKFQTQQTRRRPFYPNLLEQEIIRLKRPRFESLMSELKCDNKEHSGFENIVTVNVSPREYLLVEKICCADFEQKVNDVLMEVRKNEK